ncbi:Sterol desaturase/sphingolipid hydroxylase, fatty acid hydroxylase superfamily [Cnuella takakiae]|uniref:Sterol desaturase/sphingolipid hydroxylase, fatty acid hydroxylase superfamily n=1 Tax=Cnuella takakiae TaxID=1302690 RepID=A0A1M5GF38_9BACT|nr:sterol desaturase family protein [Cnuella takakiae]OLY92397.1 C-5 sterol desaturase [Cnuella takakiae]SHG02343.1 Sterol desaturase/sphingolipid hydroxylase, fatty acid hydroxylase superfamily [Cnuella takakiae]
MPPAILYYAIPFFVLLLSIEAYLAYREQKHQYHTRDTLSSLALGIGNVLTGLITKAIIFGIFSFLYQYRIFTLASGTWWFWVLLFFADDFSYYWFHRSSHRVGWFWASHVVHHSSQHYNLAAALRQTWTGNLTGAFLFWAWMPLAGFPPIYVLFMQQISLIYQFWIHTEWIDRLPRPLEFFFNTPSHHRVHHGSDAKYLDRNHGGVLIIWDRLFKTFQPEEEKPTYGLTTNIGSFNPIRVAFKTWGELFSLARRSGSLKTGIRYFLAPPGWRHDGLGATAEDLRKKRFTVTKEPTPSSQPFK